MAEEKKLLEIENLRKYFPINGVKGPGVQAVQDVSLYIKKVRHLVLLGNPAAVKLHSEEPSFVSMSQPAERLFTMVRPFMTIPWIKTASLLEKQRL